MKMVVEVMALVAAAVGVVCIFIDRFDLAAVGFAMAAYFQAMANGVEP